VPESDHPAHRRVREAALRKGVEIEIVAFPESTHTAQDAARALGAELGQIVKSLVFAAPAADDRLEPVIALVSGSNRVDIARLAAVVSEPRLRRATAREVGDLTGFVIGGVPPIGFGRPVRVVMDPDLGRYQVVWAAAGTQNAVFGVPPATLRALADAEVAPLAETPAGPA
jgi:prolyl-tRNA editing enzyme YbaK/EbsC (Cys-tRNA(Pro) deacylase)